MIVLDTNVVSEPMKRDGDPRVRAWLDRQSAETLYLTTISLSELLAGLFGDRILPFDQQAAVAYAPLVQRARRQGYSISVADAQIAAIATVHGFTVATRDAKPFAAAGVPLLNPWTEG
jgi:predicted nucleic acid-binding protein